MYVIYMKWPLAARMQLLHCDVRVRDTADNILPNRTLLMQF